MVLVLTVVWYFFMDGVVVDDGHRGLYVLLLLFFKARDHAFDEVELVLADVVAEGRTDLGGALGCDVRLDHVAIVFVLLERTLALRV